MSTCHLCWGADTVLARGPQPWLPRGSPSHVQEDGLVLLHGGSVPLGQSWAALGTHRLPAAFGNLPVLGCTALPVRAQQPQSCFGTAQRDPADPSPGWRPSGQRLRVPTACGAEAHLAVEVPGFCQSFTLFFSDLCCGTS